MRRVLHLILALCLLTSITTPGFSEKPLRLFFEKNIDVEADPKLQHTVQKGEWLYKILAGRGFSGAQIQRLMPDIQAMNPHIPNLDRLLPGQVIRLPEGMTTTAPPPAPPRPAPDVPKDSYETRAYVVRSGDTLGEVLQAHGVPAKLVYGAYLDLFLQLNPSIRDANTLRVGQEIVLPVVKGGTVMAPPQEEKPAGEDAEETSNATQDEPAPQPADDRPVRLVPVSPDTQLRSATSVEAPPATALPEPLDTPPSVAPKPAPKAAEATANATNPAQARSTRTGLPLVRTILGEMRFRFMPGDESMFPLPDSGWLHVKLFETPMVETPWGERILYCPVPKSADWIEKANQLKMRVLTVSPRWSVDEVLEKTAKAFPRNFRLWNSGRDLVLTRGGIGLTLHSPQMIVLERNGEKFIHLVWTRQTPGEAPLPQGLHEVLDEARVKVTELDAYNEPSRLPTRPGESIYVPVATHMDLIRAINPADPEAYFGRNLPSDLNSLLQLLRRKEFLTQGRASAAWSSGLEQRLAIQVPAWLVSGGANRIILLDRRFADPYLVSVLSSEGYVCFILPE